MTGIEFIEGLPSKVKAEAIEGLETVFHFGMDLPFDGTKMKTTERFRDIEKKSSMLFLVGICCASLRYVLNPMW